MSKQAWSPHAAVLVCGVSNGEITPDGSGSQRFADLKEALTAFPDLDPTKNTERFTRALGEPQSNEIRFETWTANKFYST